MMCGKRLSTVFICLVLAGCSVHEVETVPRPVVSAPETYPAGGGPLNEVAWWRDFNDPGLDRLIARALRENLTAYEFAARVLQAREVAVQAGAERRPLVDGFASAGLDTSGNGGLDDDTWGDAEYSTRIGVLATWEIDLFGRLKNRQRAAVADAVAAAEDLAAVRLAVAADVAAAYYRAAEQRLLLTLLEQQASRDQTLLELIELRFAQGVTTSADLLRQRAQVADVRSLVPSARSELRRAENTLDVLLGRTADGRERVASDLPAIPETAAVGVPTDLLRRRPDLRARQLQLLAADYRVGVAVAERLPRLTLVGSLGYADDGSGSGFAGSIVAELVAPLIDWGRREAVVNERRAEYAALLAAYGQSFIEAVAEVDSLLFAERQQRERVRLLAVRNGALESAVAESRGRYAAGQGDYLDVLTALDDLQETQRELLAARRELVQFRIDLHRAVGGGLGDAPETEFPEL
jgi:NodT family efflux transporter outer membrane factor (OMF) lipoprotein